MKNKLYEFLLIANTSRKVTIIEITIIQITLAITYFIFDNHEYKAIILLLFFGMFFYNYCVKVYWEAYDNNFPSNPNIKDKTKDNLEVILRFCPKFVIYGIALMISCIKYEGNNNFNLIKYFCVVSGIFIIVSILFLFSNYKKIENEKLKINY